MEKEEKAGTTAILPRNFTITTEERLRALASGPPPYALRRRRIEDLEASILRKLKVLLAKARAPLNAAALPFSVRCDISELNRLIDDHNRYYPIEANLPIDLRTAKLIDWGELWVPEPKVSAEDLLAKARTQR